MDAFRRELRTPGAVGRNACAFIADFASRDERLEGHRGPLDAKARREITADALVRRGCTTARAASTSDFVPAAYHPRRRSGGASA